MIPLKSFKCKGPRKLPDDVLGIWLVNTKGHPTHGLYWDTHSAFVIEAQSFDQVVEYVRKRLSGNMSHDEYQWTVERVGVSYSGRKRLKVLSTSYNAG